MGKTEKPWTWDEIAKLEGKALKAFLADYGERGQVARVLARMVAKGQWLPCPVRRGAPCPILSDHWQEPDQERGLSCRDRAPLIYSRMIAKLGRMPEGM